MAMSDSLQEVGDAENLGIDPIPNTYKTSINTNTFSMKLNCKIILEIHFFGYLLYNKTQDRDIGQIKTCVN